jgi:hypothetical protein
VGPPRGGGPAAPPRPRLAARLALALAASLALGGCIFGDDAPFVGKPATLSPENDLFSESDVRAYSWTEGIDRGKRDTILNEGSLTVTRTGDSVGAGGEIFVRLTLSSPAGAAAEAGQLGLDPARLLLDSVHARDPGSSLRFPTAPVVGWRLDTTVGDLRFVRVLTRTQTVRSLGKDVQCWVFAESTYWGNQPIAYGRYWMGKTGLVRHRREWKSYEPGDEVAGGTLWREIKAIPTEP